MNSVTPEGCAFPHAEACAVRFEALENADTEQKTALSRIEEKIDSLRNWLVGVLVSALGACLLLLATVVLHKTDLLK
jgi:hypothetical protein